MANKSGLGRGLSSLITESNSIYAEELEQINSEKCVEEKGSSLTEIDIYRIEPDKNQPRKVFEEESLAELASSIKQYGVLQPLIVQKVFSDDTHTEMYYKIIAGERRWRAAKLAGLEKVPVRIENLEDYQAYEVSLIENLQRQNLNAMEEAHAYNRLSSEYNMTQEQMAEHVGKSREVVANALRLLNLHEEVQKFLSEDLISASHAKVLLSAKDKNTQYELAKRVIKDGLSVRALEKLIASMQKEKGTSGKAPQRSNPVYSEIESNLGETFGTKVYITPGKKKSKIEIEYYSEDDLERIYDLLCSIGKTY